MPGTLEVQHNLLIALPRDFGSKDDWELLLGSLRAQGIPLKLAHTYEETLEIVRTQKLKGIMVCAEWALANNKRFIAMTEVDDAIIPRLFVVEHENFNNFFDWYNPYNSVSDEYVHIPFSSDELIGRMKQIKILDS